MISIPLDDVRQLPAILVKLPLQLPFLIDDELRGGEKNTATLALVFFINGDFTGSQIETLRLGTPITFAESNLSVRDKTDGPAGRRYDFPDEAKIQSNCARDRYSAHAFHRLQSIHQSVVLALLERLYQNVSILWARELVSNDFHAEVSSELSACAEGRGVDGLPTSPLSIAGNASDHEQTNQKRDSIREA